MGHPGDDSLSGFAVTPYAILGVEFVSISDRERASRIEGVQRLIRHVHESIRYHSLEDEGFRWSSAVDVVYVLFTALDAARAGIDVAFSIFERVKRSRVRGERFTIRAALHGSLTQEDRNLTRDATNLEMASSLIVPMLSLCEENQLLVSRQYFDGYLKDEEEEDYRFGTSYWRTAKSGVSVEVINAWKPGLCVDADEWSAWHGRYFGARDECTAQEYEFLITDAIRSGDPITAVAAAVRLLGRGVERQVRLLCKALTDPVERSSGPGSSPFLFAALSDDLLFDLLRKMRVRTVLAEEVIAMAGMSASSCLFPVCGRIVVDVPGRKRSLPLRKGKILAEFGLWIPDLPLTGTISALDSGMLLELDHRDCEDVFAMCPDLAATVYSITRQRIIENVLLSPALFPGFTDVSDWDHGAVCTKVAIGSELDLSRNAFILLTGKVHISSPLGTEVQIEAQGRFDQLAVVGILSPLGNPDGNKAVVVRTAIVVRIEHGTLGAAQERFPVIANAWNALCAERLEALGMGWSGADPSRVKKRKPSLRYHVALSFAGEDRELARQLAELLRSAGYKVFYDDYEQSNLWGQDLYEFLSDVYRNQALYCVIFLSQHYQDKMWTKHELKAMQDRALHETQREYILPVRVDDTEVRGILDSTAYVDVRKKNINGIFELLLRKLEKVTELETPQG